MKNLVIKSIQLRELKLSLVKGYNFYQILVENTKMNLPVVESFHDNFPDANAEFNKFMACFDKEESVE
jgi:hypothetical protein